MPKPDSGASAARRDNAMDRAGRLIALFFENPQQFGEVREVVSADVRQPERRLLDHRSHMTVTMEEFVGGTLGLRVLQERQDAGVIDRHGFYAREIELLSQSGEPVQYGIVRLDLAAVPPAACELILSGAAPLGRILIEAGTLREIHDVSLVRITAGTELARRIGIGPGTALYGRVATISLSLAISLATAETDRSAFPPAAAPRTLSGDSTASSQPSQAPRPAVELLEIPLVG